MGQKVHPHGLRLGVIYNWSSRWFFSDKKLYRTAIYEDCMIRADLMKKYSYAGITSVSIERAIKKITVLIDANKKDEAKAFFPDVQSAIMRGVKKNVMKLNTASRKISRLSQKIKSA